jgi:phage terminase large subunit
VLGFYVQEMRQRGYSKALCTLPHDGVTTNWASGKQYKDHLADAGFEVEVVSNQGAGAAMMRIEAVRRIMPRCWFSEGPTEAGRDALGYYHERKDENRNVGLGPNHDWSSHAADAFGLMAIAYEEPRGKTSDDGGPRQSSGGSVWAA